MKMALSIPDPIFDAAERVAKRLGVSRSRLYTMAIEKILQSQRSRVREVLDAVHEKQDSEFRGMAKATLMRGQVPFTTTQLGENKSLPDRARSRRLAQSLFRTDIQ